MPAPDTDQPCRPTGHPFARRRAAARASLTGPRVCPSPCTRVRTACWWSRNPRRTGPKLLLCRAGEVLGRVGGGAHEALGAPALRRGWGGIARGGVLPPVGVCPEHLPHQAQAPWLAWR